MTAAAATAVEPATDAPKGPRSKRWRYGWILEVGVLIVLYRLYDFGREKAVFSVFRRASEVPLYRIEKNPRLARRQGAYSVISATGHIVRRGHELDGVLRVLDKSLSIVRG